MKVAVAGATGLVGTKMLEVRGHATNKENNYCDELAVAAAMGGNLLIDEGYNSDETNSDEV